MKNKSLYFSIFFSFLAALQIVAQQETGSQKLISFVKNISTFDYRYPHEKVYLHFDNTGYYLGETMWFKCHVVTSKLNAPTTLSKVLYVELLTPKGDILETKKLKIEDGQCNGEFLLKDSLYAGFYEVRAYTRCMLNFGEDCIFSRVFPVYNKPGKKGQYTPKVMKERPSSQSVPDYRAKVQDLKKINLSFYPEGGQLIKGLSSQVAFKATDKEGKSIDVNCSLNNEQGDILTSFGTIHKGMGLFNLTPDGGKYSIHATFEGKEQQFELPACLSSGYVMEINNMDSETMAIQLQKSPDISPDTLGLSFTCRGGIYVFQTVCITDSDGFQLKVPKKYLPSGVIQITLFSQKGEVFAERLAFVNHHEQLSIKPKFSRISYQPFDSVSLSFDVTNKLEKPVKTTLSVSVRDKATKTGENNTGDILTDLLLTSDLKGYVESPAYYFESNDRAHYQALNLLMLTQGWRKYSWKQMAGLDSVKIKYPIEPGLVIDGTVLSDFRKKPKENVNVIMWISTPGSLSQRGKSTTDKDGRFLFLLNDFYGSGNLSLETQEKGKKKDTRILIDRVFNPTPRAFTSFDTEVIDSETASVTHDSNTRDTTSTSSNNDESNPVSHQLKEVEIKTKKEHSFESEGLEHANIIYDVAKETDLKIDKGEEIYSNILEFLRETNKNFAYPSSAGSAPPSGDVKTGASNELGGVRKDKTADDTFEKDSYLSSDSNYTYKNKKVIFVIDNIRIVNDNKNRDIPFEMSIDQIKTISISEDPTLWHQYCPDIISNGPHVVIFIYTYKDGESHDDPIGIRKTNLQGYSYVKDFYNPTYKDFRLPDLKDFRRTLYWDPDVQTDSTGYANVHFYNNGSCKNMEISVETVTKSGIIGSFNK